MAIFGYGRVSTTVQNTINQKLELEQAGFNLDFWFSDTGISGKTCASQRPEFARLLEKIRDGETIVVSKICRLGRDAVDVLQTVQMLASRQIKVIVHQLGQTDLTSPAGKLLLTMLSAVAAMERDRMAIDRQRGVRKADAAAPGAKDAVIFKEIGRHLGRGDVVDPGDGKAGPARGIGCPGPQDRTPDAAEAVEENLHDRPSCGF